VSIPKDRAVVRRASIRVNNAYARNTIGHIGTARVVCHTACLTDLTRVAFLSARCIERFDMDVALTDTHVLREQGKRVKVSSTLFVTFSAQRATNAFNGMMDEPAPFIARQLV
jgi:hypothetical protein